MSKRNGGKKRGNRARRAIPNLRPADRAFARGDVLCGGCAVAYGVAVYWKEFGRRMPCAVCRRNTALRVLG